MGIETLSDWLSAHKYCKVTITYDYDAKTNQNGILLEMVVPVQTSTSVCIKDFHIYEPSNKAILETLDRMYELAMYYD